VTADSEDVPIRSGHAHLEELRGTRASAGYTREFEPSETAR
jgi:hypothetical protein